MTTSRIFHTTQHKRIEKAIVALLNFQPGFLSARTALSTCAIGDAIQTIL
jgi:hypothetical protein